MRDSVPHLKPDIGRGVSRVLSDSGSRGQALQPHTNTHFIFPLPHNSTVCPVSQFCIKAAISAPFGSKHPDFGMTYFLRTMFWFSHLCFLLTRPDYSFRRRGRYGGGPRPPREGRLGSWSAVVNLLTIIWLSIFGAIWPPPPSTCYQGLHL